jgi:hypothetical protein
MNLEKTVKLREGSVLSYYCFQDTSFSQIFKRLKDWGVVLSERCGRKVLKELFLKLEERSMVSTAAGSPETVKFLRRLSEYLEDGKSFLPRERAREFVKGEFLGLQDEVRYYLHPDTFKRMSLEKREVVKVLKKDGLITGSEVIRTGKTVHRFYVMEEEVLGETKQLIKRKDKNEKSFTKY